MRGWWGLRGASLKKRCVHVSPASMLGWHGGSEREIPRQGRRVLGRQASRNRATGCFGVLSDKGVCKSAFSLHLGNEPLKKQRNSKKAVTALLLCYFYFFMLIGPVFFFFF